METREVQGVQAAMVARLVVSSFGFLSLPFTATIQSDQIRTALACCLGIGLGLFGLRFASKPKFTTPVGVLGVAFDVSILVFLPWSWYAAVGGSEVPAGFLAKTEVLLIGATLVAVNTLSLRPLYPLLVAVAGACTQIGLLLFGLADPRTLTTTDPLETHMGPAVHVGFAVSNAVTLVLIGVFLAAVAAAAQKMIWRAVALEVETADLRAREAHRVASAKLSGLTSLVAGLAHEINTPLGALSSGADSAKLVTKRIQESLDSAGSLEALRSDKRLALALHALDTTSSVSKEAGERIQSLVLALKDFAHLDQSELETTDLREGLESVIALIPPALLGGIDVVKDFHDVPRVRCRVREINQVFMTLVENALEAMEGQGTLTLKARAEASSVLIEVKDTGPGLSSGEVSELFELRFHRKKERIGMGLGLPVGRKVVLEHGGDLHVESVPGFGASFCVRLPI